MADRAFLEQFARRLADEGKLIEAGWVGLRLAVIAPDAPALQLSEMRLAFFAGAQHLLSSLATIMDDAGGADAAVTDKDLSRLELIHAELQTFAGEFEARRRKVQQ